jgi:integrase
MATFVGTPIPVSPLAGVKRPKQGEERRRIMTESELKAYWDAATRIGYPVGHYFKFLLLTGQRRDETRIAQWDQIQNKVWYIPGETTKNGLPHKVHLSEEAMAVLEECFKSSKWLFTEFGQKPIAGAGDIWALQLALMVNPGVSAAEIRAKAKNYQGLVSMYQGTELRLHDVRRSMASTMVNSLTVPPHVVHKILNHEQRDTPDKSYLQYEMLPEIVTGDGIPETVTVSSPPTVKSIQSLCQAFILLVILGWQARQPDIGIPRDTQGEP